MARCPWQCLPAIDAPKNTAVRQLSRLDRRRVAAPAAPCATPATCGAWVTDPAPSSPISEAKFPGNPKVEIEVLVDVSRVARGLSRASGAIGLCMAGLLAWAAATGEASARTERTGTKRGDAPAGPRDKTAKPVAGPLMAVVSLSRQRISIYSSNGLIAQSAVSTGQPGFRTPTGVFTVLQKSRYHRSNIYSGAPMPYMQRITWSGVALHAGVVPGYPASHGCIRLPHHFAVQLWGMTKLGARVIVAPDDTPAVEISSPRLPAPTLTPAPNGPSAEEGKAELLSVALGGQGGQGAEGAGAA